MTKECSIEGCSKPMKTRGWCQMHYMRWWTTGELGPSGQIKSQGEALEVRFWRSVTGREDPSGCWLWTGTRQMTGYGRFPIGRGSVPAHRFAYEQLACPVPDGLELDHLCRVRNCVNPAHLEPVTRAENNRRRWATYTHCKNGHDLTDPANLYFVKGRRVCKACQRARSAAYYQRRKAKK